MLKNLNLKLFPQKDKLLPTTNWSLPISVILDQQRVIDVLKTFKIVNEQLNVKLLMVGDGRRKTRHALL